MSIKRSALNGFTNVKDDALLVRGITVLQAMALNTTFPDPRPTLEEAGVLLEDFQNKLSASRRPGSPRDTAAKNESREALEKALQQLALYVTHIADGNLQKLLSSGFELSGYPQTGVYPDVVRDIILRDGKQKGQMRMDFRSQKQALLYEYRYAEYVDGIIGTWSEVFVTSASKGLVIAPLVSFRLYAVQVRAVNGYGRSEWSETVSYAVH